MHIHVHVHESEGERGKVSEGFRGRKGGANTVIIL